jgi:ABC-type bacteriocin/lantibiotic exporter with double-glycine peptidase domain
VKAGTSILQFAYFVLAALPIFGAAQQQSSAGTPTGIWLEVPFVAQSPDGCGSAALSMLLQYWSAHGTPVDSALSDAQTIQRSLYSRKARGILASDMEKYLRDSGFTVFAIQGNWQDLSSHLNQGRPLIVALQPGALQPGTKKSPLHYVVVVGLDLQNPAVLVHDPARGKLLRIDRAEFEKEWQPLGNWTLLAVPAQAN